jgi:hypothetical protein
MSYSNPWWTWNNQTSYFTTENWIQVHHPSNSTHQGSIYDSEKEGTPLLLTHSTPDLSRQHHLHTFSQNQTHGWENIWRKVARICVAAWENQSHGQNLRYWVIYINWKLMNFKGWRHSSNYDNIKLLVIICEILHQRLISGRLILHLTTTRPPPIFPSLKIILKTILLCS